VFTTLIVQPIFNLLVLIYNLIPGHNFGLAVILFTIVVRLLLWPLVKRQLHQTKLMRQLRPELKRIKKEAKGDRQKESLMMMELYKERGVSLFASFKVLILQLPILFGLYIGLTRILKDPHEIVNFAYPWLQDFGWMQQLAGNIKLFDTTLFHVVDLTRPALSNGSTYWPAMLLVIGSAVVQFYQSKQLMPVDKDARSLRQILRSAGDGKPADQSEVNDAVARSTRFLLPAMIFIFTVHLASALSLYWLVSGIVAFIQQSIVLGKDVEEMEALADKPDRKHKGGKSGLKTTITTVTTSSDTNKKSIIEGEVVAKDSTTTKMVKSTGAKKKSGKSKSAKRRRK